MAQEAAAAAASGRVPNARDPRNKQKPPATCERVDVSEYCDIEC